MNEGRRFRRHIQQVLRKYARNGQRFNGGCCNVCRGGACGGNFYTGGADDDPDRPMTREEIKIAMMTRGPFAQKDTGAQQIAKLKSDRKILEDLVSKDSDELQEEVAKLTTDLRKLTRRLKVADTEMEEYEVRYKTTNSPADNESFLKARGKSRVILKDIATAEKRIAQIQKVLDDPDAANEELETIVTSIEEKESSANPVPESRKRWETVDVPTIENIPMPPPMSRPPPPPPGLSTSYGQPLVMSTPVPGNACNYVVNIYNPKKVVTDATANIVNDSTVDDDNTSSMIQPKVPPPVMERIDLGDDARGDDQSDDSDIDDVELEEILVKLYGDDAIISDDDDEDIVVVSDDDDDEDATVGTNYAAKKAQDTIEAAVAARQRQLDNQPTENERLERRAERKMLKKMENMVKADRARVAMDNTDPNIYCEVDDLRRQRGFKSRTDCWADAVKDLEDVMDIVPEDIADAVFLKRLNLSKEEYEDLLKYNREQSRIKEEKPARPKRERISKVVSDNSAMPKTSKPTKLTWIDHVKLYAKKHKITYSEALSLAGPSWRGCKQNRTCPPKYKRCVKTKCAVKSDSQRWGEKYVLATPPKPKKKTTTRAPAKKPSGSKTSAPKKTRTPAKKPSGSKTSARKKAPAKRKTARGRGMVQ